MHHKILSIIVTYNAIPWLDKCVKSLKGSSMSTDILFVDNASIDQTCNYLQANHADCRMLALKKNIGFGRANNLGLEIALEETYDFVILLNQDTWIEPDTIEKLVVCHGRDTITGIISPLHFNPKGSLDHLFQTYLQDDDISQTDLAEKHKVEISFVNAAMWLMPIHIIKSIGGFDPIFPHYGEDRDFMNRLRFHGFKAYICPLAKMVHDRDSSAISPVLTRKYYEFINYLVNVKNPEKSFLGGLLSSYRKIFYYIGVEILKLQMNRIVADFKSMVKLTMLIPAIRRHRILNRTRACHFLKDPMN